ncbi:TlpA family protein disulfide reductase [Glycocaulis sp.]|uniref:TlpA family protein disulfide reductase n=1 Tax=Glycocaulis sp. TaxID=1969725 RepID=UPI003D1EFABD
MVERLQAFLKARGLTSAIIAAAILGLAGVLYVISTALVSSTPGPLDSYARGEMSRFVTLDEAPAQPLGRIVTGEGEAMTLADRRGGLVLVNFWATWCAPCVVEMPELDELQARLGSDDFEVMAISMDRTMDEARAFYEENALEHLALYHDPALRLAMAAGSRGLPTTILYDRHGGEIGRLTGEAAWASDDAIALIEAALERY